MATHPTQKNTAILAGARIKRLWGWAEGGTSDQDQTGERVVVVFDGKGAKAASGREHPDDIQIIYAPANRTADSIIERLAAQYGETYPLTVATADRLEQMTVFSFGALCIDPAQLLDRVLRAESALAAAVKALRRRR